MGAGLQVGVREKIYRNSGTYGTPVWNEITIAVDVDLKLTRSKAEVKARLSEFIMNLAGMKSAALSFGMIADTSIDDYNVLRDAWVNGTVIDLAIADQAIATSGADYWRGDYIIFDFGVEQKLESAQACPVEADLAYSTNAPQWVDVA